MRRRRRSPWRQRKQASRAASPCPTSARSGKKEALQRRIRAREFVFGIQAGLLSTVQEKVLGLWAVDLWQPLKAGLVMFASFVTGALLPVVPFLLPLGTATLAAVWGLSVATLLGVGVFKGVLTRQPLLRSGVEFAAIALGSAVIGWSIGRLLGGAAG